MAVNYVTKAETPQPTETTTAPPTEAPSEELTPPPPTEATTEATPPPVDVPSAPAKAAKEDRKKLVVELPADTHKRLRMYAAEFEKTLTESVDELLKVGLDSHHR